MDVYRLGITTFTTANSSTASLKPILQSSTTPKVIFGVCDSSDALFSCYQISVHGNKKTSARNLRAGKTRRISLLDLLYVLEKTVLSPR